MFPIPYCSAEQDLWALPQNPLFKPLLIAVSILYLAAMVLLFVLLRRSMKRLEQRKKELSDHDAENHQENPPEQSLMSKHNTDRQSESETDADW